MVEGIVIGVLSTLLSLIIVKFWGSILKFVGKFFRLADKAYTKRQIKKVFKKFSKTEINPLIEKSREVEFCFKDSLTLSEINEGESVQIVLESSKNSSKNLANATIQFVNESLFKDLKNYLNTGFREGTIYYLSRKILGEVDSISAKRYLDGNVFLEKVEAFPAFEKYFKDVKKIDEKGLLTTVLLQEILNLNFENDELIFEREELAKEILDFHEFILGIVTRKEFDHSTKLKFQEKHIKVKVYLVGSGAAIERGESLFVDKLNNSSKSFDTLVMISPAINANMKDRHEYSRNVGFYKSIKEKVLTINVKSIAGKNIPVHICIMRRR